MCQCAERGTCFAAFDRRHRDARRHVRDERRRRTARSDIAKEVVRVEALAFQCDEQVAGADGAAVRRHAVERDARIAVDGCTGNQASGFAETEHRHSAPPLPCVARAASASRA